MSYMMSSELEECIKCAEVGLAMVEQT